MFQNIGIGLEKTQKMGPKRIYCLKAFTLSLDGNSTLKWDVRFSMDWIIFEFFKNLAYKEYISVCNIDC